MKKLEYAAGVTSIYRKYLDLYEMHVRNITGLRMQIWSVCWHLVIEMVLRRVTMI